MKYEYKWLKGFGLAVLFTLLLVVGALIPDKAEAQKQPQGVTYDANIVRVNDGDTVVISAPFLPAPLKHKLAGRKLPNYGHL